MPNWCMTTMVVRGSESELKILADKYGEAKELAKKNEWSDLYSLFRVFGYSEEDIDNKLSFSRGWIDFFSYEDGDDEITIDYESAWTPNIEAFDTLLRERFETLEQVSLAEEPGCEVYINTDESGDTFPTKWCVFSVDDEFDTQYLETEREVVSLVNESCGTDFENVGQCLAFSETQDRVRVYEYATM